MPTKKFKQTLLVEKMLIVFKRRHAEVGAVAVKSAEIMQYIGLSGPRKLVDPPMIFPPPYRFVTHSPPSSVSSGQYTPELPPHDGKKKHDAKVKCGHSLLQHDTGRADTSTNGNNRTGCLSGNAVEANFVSTGGWMDAFRSLRTQTGNAPKMRLASSQQESDTFVNQ